MQHTPGPWAFCNDTLCQANGKYLHLGKWTESCGLGKAAEANKRLIEAAPALLDALLDALPYVEDVLSDPAQLAAFKPGTVQRHSKAIRAAIAAATGQA